MNTKFIVLMTLLIMAACDTTVNKTDKCNACTQIKSQGDCLAFGGCSWTAGSGTTAGSCAAIVKTPDPTAYCPGLANPGSKCASTDGCAYLDSKCTHFAGCSAYVKTTTSDCQAISTKCISDGTVCIDALTCDKYTTQCASTPDLNGRKCMIDATSNNCRNYTCAEADTTLNTDDACDAFSPGCVTTGAGCVSTLGGCATLTGTETTCPLMTGNDGKCKFGSGTNCALKVCTDAPTSTATDTDCGTFLKGCVTTGKGCIASKGACASYTVANPVTDCAGYIGIDGVCEGDSGATACRSRKCENGTGTTDALCGAYKTGCVTNGKACVTSRSACSSYSGTTTTCAGYIGIEGNCKGTSATTTGPCAAKVCDTDSAANPSSFTTDEKCQAIQSNCKTTGAGCVSTLLNCNTYTSTAADGSDCLTRVGLDGKCKAGTGGKCAVKACTDALATLSTNPACDSFSKGCVTTGAGCVASTTCINTVKQISCQGTMENSVNCNWNAICVPNSYCSDLPTQAICAGYKTSTQTQCIWDKTLNKCRTAVCKDYTATSDSSCNTLLSTCVTNGTICANPKNCSEFSGTTATCEAYTASCTNLSTASASSPCISKTCGNAPSSFNSDGQCSGYLSGCLTNGAGCIEDYKDCTYYTGTATTCPNYSGYVSSSKRIKCWSSSTADATCIQRACSNASSMADQAACDTFLSGCIYNGNGLCVLSSALCSSYGYTTDPTICQSFKGNGDTKCWQGTSNQCRDRTCDDYTVANPTQSQCQEHLSTCTTNGTKCVATSTVCTSFSGTVDQCNTYVGNDKACTKITACKTKVCADKSSGVTSNTDCTGYHYNCRLGAIGATACTDAQPLCTYYTFGTGTPLAADKQNYCNSLTTSSSVKCAWDTTSTNCVTRTACSQWVNGVSTATCDDYIGTKTCAKNTTDNICYTIGKCTTYAIPATVTAAGDKATWCSTIKDNADTPVACIYDAAQSTSNCAYTAPVVAPTTCEGISSPSDAAGCNTTLKGVSCQYYSSKCYTTQSQCSSYTLPSSSQAAYCTALRADNNGVVTACQYVSASSTTNCVSMACSDITGATTQTNCNVVPGCKYYGSACIAIVACASYTFPASATSDALKTLFCQNMYNLGTVNFCSFTTGGTTCSAPVSACSTYAGTSAAICQAFRDQNGKVCNWTAGSNCEAAADLCTNVPGTVADDAYCNLRTVPGLCKKATGATCEANTNTTSCTGVSATGSTNTDKATFCSAKMDPTGGYCTYVSGANCGAAVNACLNLSVTSTVDNSAYCEASQDSLGNNCAYDAGASACRIGLLCEFASSPGSQADCDFQSTGCTYYNGNCYAIKSNCNLYSGSSSAYCKELKNSSGGVCSFMTGAVACVNKGACNSYTAIGADAAAKKTACNAILTTDATGCTYFGTGTTCQAIGDCSTYAVAAATNLAASCALQVDKNGKTCFGGASVTACSQFTSCESITGATASTDCDKYIAGCKYYSNKCFTPSTTCAYVAPGTSSISYCANLNNSSTNEKCTASSDSATTCQDRTCSDPSTTTMTTNASCKGWKSTCKSDGTKCIDGTLFCSQISASDCSLALDTDNTSTCTAYATTCIDKTCSIKDVATSQGDCTGFKDGCLFNGKGCVDSTVPCSQYKGTIEVCRGFTGNNIKCWGKSATVTDFCRDRQCTDNTDADSDAVCKEFLSGCVTNGAGCISSSSSCSSYRGTQDTCAKFTGAGGKCWNTSTATATTSCVDRTCPLYPGTTDGACATFIEVAANQPAACVSNGTNCVPRTTTCSGFKGTYLTCPTFKAYDGPCKAANYSTTSAACTPKVCTEASNSLSTDAQCKDYHPLCVTTGRGCILASLFNCNYIENSTACSAKSGCQWANQCRAAPTTCASLSTQGQSICVNTLLADGTTKCAWSGGSTGTCRSFVCTDYDATLTTHKACNDKDKTCTTSGAGCVTYATCATYTTPSICAAAQTKEASVQCTWDPTKTVCRQRVCQDSTATTDTDCDTFLTGCKTSGAGCVGPQFYCSVFINAKLCQQDGYGNPCLWVDGVCYNYNDCTDATASTLAGCQKFNSLCVPGTTTCIAQTSCDKYTTLQSCTVGINNSTCGWLPTGKCQVFGACSDAAGTSNQDCINYGSNCLSDGVNCIAKGTCSSYLTSTACGNAGTDGQCTYVASSSSCRLSVCTDKVATSDADCQAYIVASGKCTTDGTTCVARAACTSYTTEAACTIGSDGIPCIYGYPVGTTTGTKSCRVKECSDLTGTTNDQCLGQISGKVCVSNGKICVKQDTCANYKNKLSCNGGGSDGACAFSPAPTTADPLAGTCQLFTSCDKANNDSAACTSKSAACQWTQTTSGATTTTSCAAKTCVQAASGTTCNYIPSFDGTKYTICNLVNNVCTASDPSTLAQANCYQKSAYTYTWSESTSKCVSCSGNTSTTNNSTNGNTTTNSTNSTTTTNGYILGVTIPIVILGLFA